MKSYTYHLLMSVGLGTLLCGQLSAQMVTINVGINQPPSLSANAGINQTACNNQSIILGGTPAHAGGTGVVSYNWAPPTGLSSPTVANPTLTAATNTTYTLTVTDQRNCTATDDVSVTIGSSAVAGFTFSANSLQVSFSNTSASATSYLWNFGDGLTSTFSNPSHTYATPGTYNVCLIAMGSGGCGDTICQTVVLTVGVMPSLVTSAELYPNPFSGNANLRFHLKNAADVQVELFDLSGKRLYSLLDTELPAGEHTLPVRAAEGNLPNGVYLIKLTVNGEAMTLRAVSER
jgi:hypothetical protein